MRNNRFTPKYVKYLFVHHDKTEYHKQVSCNRTRVGESEFAARSDRPSKHVHRLSPDTPNTAWSAGGPVGGGLMQKKKKKSCSIRLKNDVRLDAIKARITIPHATLNPSPFNRDYPEHSGIMYSDVWDFHPLGSEHVEFVLEV